MLQLGDAGPLDRFAGDRAFENVVGLVGRVDGEFEVEAVDEMDVREDAFLAVLADLLAFDGVVEAVLIEQMRDGFGRIGEDVQVDVGALPHVAGEDAADQPRAKRREAAHHRQRGEPHGEQVIGAGCAFEQPGQQLDLVADFDVAGQVGRLDPALADLPGRFLFGRVVFRLLPGIHQPGGFPGDLPPQFRAIHQRAP